MAFMELEVLPRARVFEVDTKEGIFWIPNDCVSPHPALKEGECIQPDDEIGEALVPILGPYLMGGPDSIQEICVRFGYLGRYQAPGYMDATEWSFDTNYRTLVRDLRDMYGD